MLPWLLRTHAFLSFSELEASGEGTGFVGMAGAGGGVGQHPGVLPELPHQRTRGSRLGGLLPFSESRLGTKCFAGKIGHQMLISATDACKVFCVLLDSHTTLRASRHPPHVPEKETEPGPRGLAGGGRVHVCWVQNLNPNMQNGVPHYWRCLGARVSKRARERFGGLRL